MRRHGCALISCRDCMYLLPPMIAPAGQGNAHRTGYHRVTRRVARDPPTCNAAWNYYIPYWHVRKSKEARVHSPRRSPPHSRPSRCITIRPHCGGFVVSLRYFCAHFATRKKPNIASTLPPFCFPEKRCIFSAILVRSALNCRAFVLVFPGDYSLNLYYLCSRFVA